MLLGRQDHIGSGDRLPSWNPEFTTHWPGSLAHLWSGIDSNSLPRGVARMMKLFYTKHVAQGKCEWQESELEEGGEELAVTHSCSCSVHNVIRIRAAYMVLGNTDEKSSSSLEKTRCSPSCLYWTCLDTTEDRFIIPAPRMQLSLVFPECD